MSREAQSAKDTEKSVFIVREQISQIPAVIDNEQSTLMHIQYLIILSGIVYLQIQGGRL